MFSTKTTMLATCCVFAAAPAFASTQVLAITDLNLREGPGPNYAVTDVIEANDFVQVDACIAESHWCRVQYGGKEGWAFGGYLATSLDDTGVLISSRPDTVQIDTVTVENEDQAEAALAGGTMGAAAGALIVGGPAAIGIGAMLGLIGGAAAEPDTQVVTYVRQNPVETVYLRGETVVGATIPDTVVLTPVPESEYAYLYLNGQPVLVETENRTIVHVVR